LDIFAVDAVVLENGEIDMTGISEASWHGAVLSLAECARLSLIDIGRWSLAITWLMAALQLDQRRSTRAIGTSVRDAACYVLWSITRSSSQEAILLFSDKLAHLLVAVSLFDREVQIRRAASAVFQEAVGRLDAFVEGIPILQHMNFNTVTSTRNAYLEVCPALAGFALFLAAALKSHLRH
jgi:hypothetical protein